MYLDHLLNEKLTVVPQFHSHLEAMKSLTYLDQQISFSYSENNNIILSGPFSSEVDPTRYVRNSYFQRVSLFTIPTNSTISSTIPQFVHVYNEGW